MPSRIPCITVMTTPAPPAQMTKSHLHTFTNRSDPNVPNPVQRTGLRQELLTGPVLYGLAHVAAAALGWRRSPTAVVALCALCGGDGAAELGGHWLPRVALPWNRQKVRRTVGMVSPRGGREACIISAPSQLMRAC